MKQITRYAKENRKHKTPAEKKLFNKLLHSKIKFRTQRMIDFYIVDFLIPDRWLIVEVDGKYHENVKLYDKKREQYLLNKGYKVIRFTNEQVFKNIDYIIAEILKVPLKDAPANWQELYGVSAY